MNKFSAIYLNAMQKEAATFDTLFNLLQRGRRIAKAPLGTASSVTNNTLTSTLPDLGVNVPMGTRPLNALLDNLSSTSDFSNIAKNPEAIGKFKQLAGAMRQGRNISNKIYQTATSTPQREGVPRIFDLIDKMNRQSSGVVA